MRTRTASPAHVQLARSRRSTTGARWSAGTPGGGSGCPGGGAPRTERPDIVRPVRVGVLTGGGDCPGLNAVIRAVARRSLDRGHDVVGVRAGWRGLVENQLEPLGLREISGILPRGGTIVGTSRTNPYKVEGGVERVLASFGEHRRAGRDRR